MSIPAANPGLRFGPGDPASARALLRNDWAIAGGLAAFAAVFGMLLARQPMLAIGLTALVAVTLVAFLLPVTHLTILLALTCIVPYSLQNHYSPGSGTGHASPLALDLFVLTGLLRAAVVLPSMRLDRRRLVIVALTLASVLFTGFLAYLGIRAGHNVSDVGEDFRAIGLGTATVLIVIAALDRPAAYTRVLRMMLFLGIAVGLWGIAQWTLHVAFGGDFGVRSGVALTSNGKGQIQGALFSFPVAVILSTAALASGRLRSRAARALVLLALVLNAVSLLLTFERTYWVAGAAGVLLVGLRSGPARAPRVLVSIAATFVVAALVLAAVSPTTFTTAEQRLTSIGQYQTDNSVRYREVESRYVAAKIREHPLLGSGLADTIYWGQPWLQSRPAVKSYTHVGYLWLLWREGILGTALLLALLLAAALWPGRAAAGGLVDAVRKGAQVSLLALLVINTTFPLFQAPEGTYLTAFLVGLCAVPLRQR